MRTLKKVTGMEMSGSTAHRHDSNKAFMLVAVRLTFVLRTRTLTSSRGFLHSVAMHVCSQNGMPPPEEYSASSP